MKIVSTGRALNSSEFYKKKRRRRKILSILTFILVLLFVTSVVVLLRLERFLVSEIVVEGANEVSREDISESVTESIGGNYLWLIPQSNFLLIPREEIRGSLLVNFPWLNSVDLRVEEKNKLIVHVNERIPFALYCSDTPPVEESLCYFLDQNGLIFANVPNDSRRVYFVYSTREKFEEPISTQFVPEEEFIFLPAFIDSLSILGINPIALEVSEYEYKLYMSGGGYVLWGRSTPLELVRANLETFLFSDPIRSQRDFIERVLYLDLLTENKVFYKFKED
ncbi:MAG: FtsQ-type POTRA domain-containing protein [Parcubacteria group bacterium]